MKELKTLIEYINEELDDAEKYAICAAKNKEGNESLKNLFIELSEQELKHSEMLHKEAAILINEYVAQGHKAPESMQSVWEWEHERAIDRTARIKYLLVDSK